MKTIKTMEKLLLTVMLVFILSACGSKQVQQETLQTQSNQEVRYQTPLEADSYRWKQLSGVSVTLSDPSSQTLHFIAPVVTQEETLVFELEAKLGEKVQKIQVRVIVSPVASSGEEDNTTGGGDNNTSNGGSTDTNGTGSGSDDGNSTGGGTDANGTTGGGSNDGNTTGRGDDNTTTTPTVTLKSLNLTVDKTLLNKDENTTVKVIATYADNTTKEIINKVEWLITPKDAVAIKGNTLTALKDTNVTLQAKVGNALSNKVTLQIYWEVNGHRLPPEPDTKVNDATLLGVDVNHNGVRDDVERWIYEEYKDKHPIYIDIAMQAARGYRLVLEHPERAKEIYPVLDATTWCEGYYKIYAKYFNEPILVKDDISTKFFREKIYFNTKERMAAYIKYDTLLSGDSYSTPAVDKNMSSYCDFNISKYGE